MKHCLQSCAEQPAQQGIPLRALLGWLIYKLDQHRASTIDAKHILIELAKDEHRLHRMKIMVDVADALLEEEISTEGQIDKLVLTQCLPLCAKEVAATKDALKAVA